MPPQGALNSTIAAAAEHAARAYATPFYLTDLAAIARAAAHLEGAFPDPWVRSYSLKADPLPAIVSSLAARGWGANAVSLGEISAARSAGVPSARITLEGIGKGDAEFNAAITAAAAGDPLRWVALESEDDARALIAAVASRKTPFAAPIRILIRLNPAIEPGTHAGLAVGRRSSKFGCDARELHTVATLISAAGANLELIGIHLHAGSQLREMSEWQIAVERSLAAYASLVQDGLIRDEVQRARGTLCVGGGQPVGLDGDDGPQAQARAFRAAADAAWSGAQGAVPLIRAIEPGRALVATATHLITRVLHVRDRTELVHGPLAAPGEAASRCERQVVLDAGMSELVRPALYGARHPILTVKAPRGEPLLSSVHGPICESTDALGAHLLPSGIARGDLLAIAGAGAYADAMWSPYNSRPRPARLAVSASGTLQVLRRAEAVEPA